MRHSAIITSLLGITLGTAAAPAATGVGGAAVVHVDVGPGVTAGGRLANGEFECSDGAKCVFETPAPSKVDISARGPAGHALRWTGCTRQPAANRCTVEIIGGSVLVTVQ